jgi:hypothetical protein
MVELKEDQWQALNGQEQPPIVIDPKTGQIYRLIKQEIYELARGILKPLGQNWDNPADDNLIRKDL